MPDEKLPEMLNTAGLLQITSGVLNVFVVSWMAYFAIATGGSFVWICTMGLCPAFLCGLAGFLLVPIGIFEILSGILIMTNNPSALQVQRLVSIVQKVSILFGGVGSVVVSFVVDGMINSPEVLAFLEAND